ncbi:MAG TPA: hypothetical protein VFO05_11430 [Candidatus Limnocylindrales bacterium]|nr:hypothetical protein [Candidatus Limnocylindrales bacterium]
MNRSGEPLFDSRIADWLEEDPHRAPDQTLQVVLAAVPSLKQRGALRAPWRNPFMSIPIKVGLSAAAVVLAASAVFLFVRGPQGSTGAPSPTPTSAASPVSTPAASPSTGAPSPRQPATTTFTSPVYGYTIEHPTAFLATAATEPWPAGGIVGNEEPWVDRFFSNTSFVGIASQPLASGETPDAWMSAYADAAVDRGCSVPADAWTDVTIRDIPGRRADFDCNDFEGVELVWVIGDRGWVMTGGRAVVDLMVENLTIP